MSKPEKALWLRLLLGRRPAWTLVRVLVLVLVSFVVFKFILLPVRVTGPSMEPTCKDGQVGFISLLSYFRQRPARGDIVAFRSEDQHIVVKRVLGLPGERITFHSGEVLINGKPLAEPYLESPGNWEWPEETLGATIFFVAGDNRSLSQQFRVESSQILGRLIFHRN